jgi:hypothetical protein
MKFSTSVEMTPAEALELLEAGIELVNGVIAEIQKQQEQARQKATEDAAQSFAPGLFNAASNESEAYGYAVQEAAQRYDRFLNEQLNVASSTPDNGTPAKPEVKVSFLNRAANLPAEEPALDEVDEFIKMKLDIQQRLEAVQGNAREMFTKGVMRLFEKHPDLKIIHWKQYVPSFNDGDPCTFSMYDQCVNGVTESGSMTDDDMTDYLDEDDNAGDLEFVEQFQEAVQNFVRPVSYSEHEAVLKQQYPWLAEVFDFLNAFSNDYETMFDSNAEVVITREGVKVSEYYCGY